MELIFKHSWILFIVVTLFNTYFLKTRVQPYIDEKPERKEGYDLIFKNLTIYSLIPWIIVGIGNLSGKTLSIFDYFSPSKMNPFVLTFHFSIIIIWILLVHFVFFKNGAEFLENHPGIIRFKGFGITNESLSKNSIKLFVIITMLGGILGMLMMWFTDFPDFSHFN